MKAERVGVVDQLLAETLVFCKDYPCLFLNAGLKCQVLGGEVWGTRGNGSRPEAEDGKSILLGVVGL